MDTTDDVKKLTAQLATSVRDGSLTPQEAVKQFEQVTPTQLRTGRIYAQKGTKERAEQYRKARAIRVAIRKSRVPFIAESFLPNFWLSQGLIIVGAESGRAKSTTCSNVLHGFLASCPDKTAIVISNEEATDAVYERTACIALKKDYIQFFRGRLPPKDEALIIDYVETIIIPRVEVIEDGSFDMSYLEDVQSVLETAAINRVGLVLIDYLQIINQSRKQVQMETFQISKQLGIFLKDYGKKHGVPVVCFTQLHSSSRGPTMAERIQNDKTFFNHGFACIEVIPNFESLTTTFKLHKDRFFGHTGKEVVCDFVGGMYVFNGGGL